MPKVLTTNASIRCPHGQPGVSKLLNLKPKWSINGGDVLCEGDSGTFPTCLPPVTPVPCVGYTLQSMGLNATYIDGRRVMLVTDFNTTFTGLPLVMNELHSTYDDSTPVPIPAGQPAPPLSPELADMLAPEVTVTPQTLTFSKSSNTPQNVTAKFDLRSKHPLQWILTLIMEKEKKHVDLTNGPPSILPPGMTVTPTHGTWLVSPLQVTMTMNAAFMKTLTPNGDYRFFMTGVSRRGLSAYAKPELVLHVNP